PSQFPVYLENGQSHHVEVRTFYSLYSNIANPLLHTVSTCLVRWIIFFHIIIDLIVRQLSECNMSRIRKTDLFLFRGQGNSRNHTMCFSGEFFKHPFCISLV